MSHSHPDYTLGIEEEYLLVDPQTGALAEAPQAFMDECGSALEGQFSPEFLQCQIEIGTKVCADIHEARDDLKRLRSTVAKIAQKHGLAPIAASCHPFAEWRRQHHTDKERYNELSRDLAGVGQRMLICGMHVHVGVDDKDQRIDIVNQLSYFLPHLLALSASSPFWQGHDTGLSSYRLTVFDNLPRTGLPPHFDSWGQYERSVNLLVQLGMIEDSSKIWWDLRPSARFPTIESRICDVSPLLENTLSLAAITQCLTRMLRRLATNNQRWRIYDNFLIAENRWRAQRYGISEGLIDFGAREVKPISHLMIELFELLAEDMDALKCQHEVEAAANILGTGTSADRQRAVYKKELANGGSEETALRAIVNQLIEEFQTDL